MKPIHPALPVAILLLVASPQSQRRTDLVNLPFLASRASVASEPRERSEPAKRRARERVGESEGQSPAVIEIDAAKVENRISPRLYGQFAEFMFENIKFGLHAELLRNRGFEETANIIGLPRHWERHPDDRNDDGIRFTWDDEVAYPAPSASGTAERLHSLRIDVSARDGHRRGFYQARVPVRAGIEYRGSVWLRSQDFAGRLTASLEQDRTGGDVYADADGGEIAPGGAWQQFRFALRSAVDTRSAADSRSRRAPVSESRSPGISRLDPIRYSQRRRLNSTYSATDSSIIRITAAG